LHCGVRGRGLGQLGCGPYREDRGEQLALYQSGENDMGREQVRLVLFTLDCRNTVAGSDGLLAAARGYRDCGLMTLGSGSPQRLGAPETEEP